jgi:hypothetical protein
MSKDKPEQAEPGQLEGPWSLKRLLDSLLDLILATAALLFVLFGGMIYMNHGTPATPGSTGRLLLDLAKYVCCSPQKSLTVTYSDRVQPCSPSFSPPLSALR